MRRRPGSAPTSSRHGRSGGGAVQGSPGAGPAHASSTAAESRTERVRTCSQVFSPKCSPKSGPSVMRPREGLRPTTPQQLAGIRIDPPESLPCATGTNPAATAAAAPPLEPPAVRCRSQGLRVAPYATESVIGLRAISERLLLPRMANPARL